MLRNLFLIGFVFFHLSSFCQNFDYAKNYIEEDTLFVAYLSGFEYDIIVLYVNGIRVDQQLLYSEKSTGSTYKGLTLPIINDTLTINMFYIEKNHKFSIEYNALWWKWDLFKDKSFYFSPKKTKITVMPKETPYIGVSIKCNKWENNICIDKYPIIISKKTPFILD